MGFLFIGPRKFYLDEEALIAGLLHLKPDLRFPVRFGELAGNLSVNGFKLVLFHGVLFFSLKNVALLKVDIVYV